MTDGRTFQEIRAAYPFPWATVQVVGKVGLIQVRDAGGVEVPLFTVLRLVELTTQAGAARANHQAAKEAS